MSEEKEKNPLEECAKRCDALVEWYKTVGVSTMDTSLLLGKQAEVVAELSFISHQKVFSDNRRTTAEQTYHEEYQKDFIALKNPTPIDPDKPTGKPMADKLADTTAKWNNKQSKQNADTAEVVHQAWKSQYAVMDRLFAAMQQCISKVKDEINRG